MGTDLDESKELAREHAAANELPFFEDGAEPAQFDGYEAIGREILEQLGTAAGAGDRAGRKRRAHHRRGARSRSACSGWWRRRRR